ncbi:PREDICTED: uncharacterized protein LOC108354150, partial [Rhagoletis zephyria]|uniref:uncharacterized protein LOC108354150 n=1 Tax=Rhagoletis zephyria TaxID=28612 RepID=UPI0008118DAF
MHSPDLLRRSASLRMRGSKSNLFNDYRGNYMEMERSTRHLSNATPHTANTRYNHPLLGALEQQQQQQQPQPTMQRDIHERHNAANTATAGSFGGVVAAATRRKAAAAVVLLPGSTLSTQTPAVTVGNLTRSQSLRRSYLNHQNNYYAQQKSFKTDALKDKSAGGVTAIGSGAETTGADVAITGTVGADNVAPLKTCTQREQQQPAVDENYTVPNGSVQSNDITHKMDGVGVGGGVGVGELRRIDRDMQKMFGNAYLLRLGVTSSIDFLTPVSQNF